MSRGVARHLRAQVANILKRLPLSLQVFEGKVSEASPSSWGDAVKPPPKNFLGENEHILVHFYTFYTYCN